MCSLKLLIPLFVFAMGWMTLPVSSSVYLSSSFTYWTDDFTSTSASLAYYFRVGVDYTMPSTCFTCYFSSSHTFWTFLLSRQYSFLSLLRILKDILHYQLFISLYFIPLADTILIMSLSFSSAFSAKRVLVRASCAYMNVSPRSVCIA